MIWYLRCFCHQWERWDMWFCLRIRRSSKRRGMHPACWGIWSKRGLQYIKKHYNMVPLIGTFYLKKTFYANCSTSFDTVTQSTSRSGCIFLLFMQNCLVSWQHALTSWGMSHKVGKWKKMFCRRSGVLLHLLKLLHTFSTSHREIASQLNRSQNCGFKDLVFMALRYPITNRAMAMFFGRFFHHVNRQSVSQNQARGSFCNGLYICVDSFYVFFFLEEHNYSFALYSFLSGCN
jgi:hypothetical protein